jgi:hypothetical protein
MGGGGFGFTFDPSSFFLGIIDSLIAVINAIISALVFLFNLLVVVVNFLYAALVTIATALVNAVKLIARGFIHVISDIIHGRFLHLFQDYLDLKAKITAWLQPILDFLKKVKALFDKYVLAPLLRTINLIQKIRQFLVIFRILGFKWAAKLDNQLAALEQRLVRNTLVLQSWLNFAISILSLVIDPSLILRRNFLLASLLSFLGAVKRVVFFGWSRSPTPDEAKQMQQSRQLLAPKSQLLVAGVVKNPQYDPAVQTMLDNMDAAVADYKRTGSYSPQGA